MIRTHHLLSFVRKKKSLISRSLCSFCTPEALELVSCHWLLKFGLQRHTLVQIFLVKHRSAQRRQAHFTSCDVSPFFFCFEGIKSQESRLIWKLELSNIFKDIQALVVRRLSSLTIAGLHLSITLLYLRIWLSFYKVPLIIS